MSAATAACPEGNPSPVAGGPYTTTSCRSASGLLRSTTCLIAFASSQVAVPPATRASARRRRRAPRAEACRDEDGREATRLHHDPQRGCRSIRKAVDGLEHTALEGGHLVPRGQEGGDAEAGGAEGCAKRVADVARMPLTGRQKHGRDEPAETRCRLWRRGPPLPASVFSTLPPAVTGRRAAAAA